MPYALAVNVKTDEFFPFERVRSLSTGYAMAKALGYAWACNCRGLSRTPPQNFGNAQPFDYQPNMPNGNAVQVAGSEGMPRNNQTQNRQFKAVVRALGLNQDQAQRLRREISKQGLG